MAITYNSGTNIITVTGYTEAVPCNFTDVYNADVSGSWGKVTRQCTNQFYFTAKLAIGDGSTSTWFADETKQIVFSGGMVTANYQPIIDVKNNATFRLGILTDATKKVSWKGCTIISLESTYVESTINGATGATILLFSSSVYKPTGVQPAALDHFTTTSKAYNCILSWCRFMRTSADMYNINLMNGGTTGLWVNSDVVGVDKFFLTDGRCGLYAQNGSANLTYRNVYARNLNYGGTLYFGCTYKYSGNMYVIDADTDSWSFRFVDTPTPVWYRQYSFDAKVVDKDNIAIDTAKVKMWDKDDSLVTNVNTNASGVLATQTLNHGYYQQPDGSAEIMKTPHEIRIYKYGKLMLSSKSSIESKTDRAFTMLADPHITQTIEATVAAYTGITINHTTETITISSNHTLDEIYDYCQYDMIAATKQLDQSMHTSDGVNFVSEYSFVVNTGITVTATDQKLSMVSGETYTLTGTAQFTGIIATTTTTRIPVTLTGIADASRYWVGKTTGMVKIFDGTQSGTGDVVGYYEHTVDIPITIRVRKGSASPKYLNYESIGTLYAALATFTISQVIDSIA